MLPGNPCHDWTGYCDATGECQMIDMDGPLRQIIQTFFSYEGMCLHNCIKYSLNETLVQNGCILLRGFN